VLLLVRQEAIALVPCSSKIVDEKVNKIIVADIIKRTYTFKITKVGGNIYPDQNQCLGLFEFLFRVYSIGV